MHTKEHSLNTHTQYDPEKTTNKLHGIATIHALRQKHTHIHTNTYIHSEKNIKTVKIQNSKTSNRTKLYSEKNFPNTHTHSHNDPE